MFAITVNASAQFCTSDNRFTEEEYFSISELDTALNITYGSAEDHQGNTITLQMDAYFPKLSVDQMTERPLVMMIHGGGFQIGDRNARRNECIALAQRGFVVFTISYRLGWNAQDPTDQILASYRAAQDAKAAMRYIVENSATYGIDTDWLFIGGSSAGAVTSFNAVYTQESEWNLAYPGIVNDLGGLNTSTNNLTNTFDLKGIFNNWGGVTGFAVQASEMVPMISFHGELDQTVSIDIGQGGLYGSRAFHNELVNNGVCSDLSIDEDGGHGVYLFPQGAIFRSAKTACFFKSVFCDECTTVSTTDSVPANCAGINSITEQELETPLVYPNPFTDRINISTSSKIERTQLFDSLGKLIYSGLNLSDQDFSTLPSGIYTLELQKAEETRRLKLVKD